MADDQTPQEAEDGAAGQCVTALKEYLAFPSAQNYDIVNGKLRRFQQAWMRGRIRDIQKDG